MEGFWIHAVTLLAGIALGWLLRSLLPRGGVSEPPDAYGRVAANQPLGRPGHPAWARSARVHRNRKD